MDGIVSAQRPADTIVNELLRRARSGARDRAQVSALVYGALRSWFVLREALGDGASALELCVAQALRSGTPVPALREVDLDALRARLAGAPPPSTAARHNCRATMWDRLRAQYGEPQASALALALNREAGVDLRVNLLRGTREQAIELLAAEGIAAVPSPRAATGLRLGKRVPLQALACFRDGWIEPQDEGSQLLALALDVRPGERVADFCAGAGGKTLALGALMENRGELHAFDASAGRLDRMAARLDRAGLSMVRRQPLDPSAPLPADATGSFDAVLVDAPCSGTGTWRRHPELRLREPDLQALHELQLGILRRAASLLRPDGRLLYATCSVLREENEAVTGAFLAAHPDFVAGEPLRLLPHVDETDGYYALMLRRAPRPGAPGGRQ